MFKRLGIGLLDAISYLPYFKGKGFLVLGVLQIFRSELPLPARLKNGSRVWLGDDNLRQTVLPYWLGKYEPEVVRAFQNSLARLAPGDAVLDIGANVGYYTLLAGQSLRSRGHGTVYAFEPNPHVFAELERNLALNQFQNVRALPLAVGQAEQQATMYINRSAVTYGSLEPVQDFLGERVPVPVTTLDLFARNCKLSRVGLIKLDIEGGELPALRGGRELIARDLPMIIYEEFERASQHFGYSTLELRDFLTNLGYSLHPIDHMSDDGYCNVLALPKQYAD